MMNLHDVEALLSRQSASPFRVYDTYFEASGIVRVLQGVAGAEAAATVLLPKQQLAASSGLVLLGIKNMHLVGQGLDSVFWDVLLGASPDTKYQKFQGASPGEPWREMFVVLSPGMTYSVRAVNWSGYGAGYPPGQDVLVACELFGYKFAVLNGR